MSYCLAYMTCAEVAEAEKIAQQLVEERLAACVNIFPAITSIYRWQGKVERGQEVAALIKTKDSAYAAIEKKIKSLHSYDTCCVIKLPITAGSGKFLAWIDEQVTNAPTADAVE